MILLKAYIPILILLNIGEGGLHRYKSNAWVWRMTCDRSVVFSRSSGFLHQYNWPPRYSWNIVENDVKHHQTSKQTHTHIYIYVWKLNQTVLELDLWVVKFCSYLDGIWTHTIDTLQHQSLSLMSSALHHSATSAILKYGFNSRSVTLSRKKNLEVDIRNVSKRV